MDRLFQKDQYLRVFSVIVAIVLWIVVMTDLNGAAPNIVREVSVGLNNIPGPMVVLQQTPATISVKYSGNGRITRNDITATADLRNAQAGEGKYKIEVSLPSGFQLVETTPAQVTVTLDTTAAKQVPIVVNVTGAVGEDFATRPPLVQPTEVRVEGPSSLIAKVARVVGDVDVTGAVDSVTRSVPVRAVDSSGAEVRGLAIQPEVINVSVPVAKLPPGKLVDVKARFVGAPAPGFQTGTVRVEPTTVKVRGDAAAIAAVDSIVTRDIDLSGAAASFATDVQLILPTGVQLAEPAIVRVSVEVVPPQASRIFESVPVLVTDVRAGLRATSAPAAVRVTVRGPEATLAGLTVDSIKAQTSAKDLNIGVHKLTVSVFLPPGYVALEVTPVEVTVTITQP